MRLLFLTTAAFAVAAALPAFAQNNPGGGNNSYTQSQRYHGGQQGYTQNQRYQGGQQYGERFGENGPSNQENYPRQLPG